jgi:hypothetical protein
MIKAIIQPFLRPVDIDGSTDGVDAGLYSVQLTAKRSHFSLKLLNQIEQVVHVTSRDLVTVVVLISVVRSRYIVVRLVVQAGLRIRSSRSCTVTVDAASFPFCS